MSLSQVARKYLGKTEKPNNQGFNDLAFETKMLSVGFEKGQAWCSYFAELVCKEAFPNREQEFDKLFSASACQTFKNFKEAGFKISPIPLGNADSLVIWQTYKKGKPDWSGHIGILSNVINNTLIQSIEGNTNDKGGREGYIVAEKLRSIRTVENGLNILGFIIL